MLIRLLLLSKSAVLESEGFLLHKVLKAYSPLRFYKIIFGISINNNNVTLKGICDKLGVFTFRVSIHLAISKSLLLHLEQRNYLSTLFPKYLICHIVPKKKKGQKNKQQRILLFYKNCESFSTLHFCNCVDMLLIFVSIILTKLATNTYQYCTTIPFLQAI